MNTFTGNRQMIAFERHGNGLPLVLIHGYPLDHSIWDPIVPLLKEKFDVILPDLRGFGLSEGSPAQYQMADLAADVVLLLDHLGLEKAFVAGHSMGGYVALAFASLHSERISGLGLIASQALADPPERKAGRYQTAEQVEKNGVESVAEGMPSKLTADAGLQHTLKELILCQPRLSLAQALRAMAERPDSTPALSAFRFPLVLIHGLADALIPVERAREIKAAVPSAQLVEIEAAGHMPMMEKPQAVADALHGFLAVNG
jgi:3-oxoadipate enol-lactonase